MTAKIKRFILFAGLLLVFMIAVPVSATPVSSHGRLSVKGTKIVDCNGNTFQIKGVSTHGIAWYPEYVSKASFKSLRDDWGANTVRLAMYTAEYNGYCTGGNQTQLKKTIDTGVKAATDLGMYVIIDWHILSDGNPNTYKNQSISFFREMANKYKNNKNVIYEICNEPNGGTSWSQIKSYAQNVIKEIRKIDKNAIILVGTPNWSQDVDTASANKITGYKNIMYTMHFYAGTHQDSYRSKLESAVKAGLPVLVSEFGICDASGSGSLNKTQGNKWITLLNKYSIGYVSWNLSNKNESSALIKSTCSKKSGWALNDLSESGKWLVSTFKGRLASTASSASSTTKKNSSSSSTAKKSSSTAKKSSTSKAVKASKKNCDVTVKKESTWKSGNRYYALYRVKIKNKSTSTISNWKLRVNFKYQIKKDSTWNGTYTFKSKYLTISPVSWNKKITSKGTATDIGFIISYTNKNNKVTSVTFE